jgi:hypothetical protein
MTIAQEQLSPRHHTPALLLMRQALGSPAEIAYKVEALLNGATAYVDFNTIEQRLARLHKKGIVEEIPNLTQLVVGGIDMLRFWISPAAADYYQQHGINYAFHQLLRILDDPRSLMNPVGLLNSKDTIIGHLMQVVHADPDYDLQLLEMFDNGVESLAYQLEQMLQGTHPRYQSISAIVEEVEYHQRLLVYVRAWQRGEARGSLRRDNVVQNPALSARAETFGNLTNAMRYFTKLPSTPLHGALYLLWSRNFVPR